MGEDGQVIQVKVNGTQSSADSTRLPSIQKETSGIRAILKNGARVNQERRRVSKETGEADDNISKKNKTQNLLIVTHSDDDKNERYEHLGHQVLTVTPSAGPSFFPLCTKC
jgi:hypothetical protein